MVVRRSDTKTPSKPVSRTSAYQQSRGNKLHRTKQSSEASSEEVLVNMRQKESAKPSRNVYSTKAILRLSLKEKDDEPRETDLLSGLLLWCLIWACTVCQCPSPGFTNNPLYTASGFCLTRSLITLVSYNHVDNYLKEILVFVYYGSIVINNRPHNGHFVKYFINQYI